MTGLHSVIDIPATIKEYHAPDALQQADRQRYKADNCKAIVVPDWRFSDNDVSEELKK